MAGLSNIGYTKRTAEEIQNDLIEQIKLKIPDFTQQSADIQNDLINSAIPAILQMENLVSVLLNSYSMAQSDEMLFRMQAEELGLRQKSEFKSQVVLTFTGLEGDVIPKGTKVSTNLKDVIFETTEDVVIGSTNEVSVLAYSDIDYSINADNLNTLISVISKGIVVTNKEASLPSVEAEKFEDYKLRSQWRLRSPRLGGRLYAESLLRSVEGVDPRLVCFNEVDYTVKDDTQPDSEVYYRIKGIEAIIGGGYETEIAFVLYQSFFETQKLVSNPSSNEIQRTVDKELYVFDNTVNIKFTRPKLLRLNLKLKITFINKISSGTAVKENTITTISNFVNNLKVGSPINLYTLINLITPDLIAMGLPTETYKAIQFQYAIGDFKEGGANHGDLIGGKIPWKDFNSDDRIPEILGDCYCVLESYEVQLNA